MSLGVWISWKPCALNAPHQGTTVNREQPVRTPCQAREEDAMRVCGYTTSTPSGHRVRPGRRTQRVCAGTLMHHEQTVRTPC